MSDARPPDPADQVERALLGALLLLGANALELIPRLRPGHFRSQHRAAVFAAILKLTGLGTSIDSLTVSYALLRGKTPAPPGQHWMVAIPALLDQACSTDDDTIKWAAKTIEEEARRRELRALTPLADVLAFSSRGRA